MTVGVQPKKRRTGSAEKILAAAAGLFHANGIRGVGMDQVIAESGVAKSTLYAHFPTRDALIGAYLRSTDISWRLQLRTAAEASGPDPQTQLVGLFDALRGSFDRHGFFGCPFISAAVETALDSEARALTIEHSRRRNEWLLELARRTGSKRPESLARQIGVLIDGALATGRLLQDARVIDDAQEAAEALVRQHLSN
ncbi:TetR/AcrR family transcriptional regulator [Arthrobacter sp. NPDC058127]|uniref:TetR/AcrR family transcriptional regulator n=1 Tax=Arthrobacter sp. NPDC058127 TaxID=3346351 RepID=UPI0036E1FCFA